MIIAENTTRPLETPPTCPTPQRTTLCNWQRSRVQEIDNTASKGVSNTYAAYRWPSALVEVAEEGVGKRSDMAHAPSQRVVLGDHTQQHPFSSNFAMWSHSSSRVIAYTCDATNAGVKARTGHNGAAVGQCRAIGLGRGLQAGTHHVGVGVCLMCSLSCTCRVQGINPRGCRVRVLVQGRSHLVLGRGPCGGEHLIGTPTAVRGDVRIASHALHGLSLGG